MATRIYLPSSGAAAFDTLAFSAYWNFIETSHVHLACGKTKTSTAQAYASISTWSPPRTNNQFISGQFNAHDFTTAETVQAIVRCLADANDIAYLAMSIRVISADGGTVRGTLFQGAGPTTIPSGAWTNRSLGVAGAAVAIQNNVSMLAGDRICIEVGANGASGTGVYPYFGDAAASDLAANETGTDAYNPWVQFSATLADYSEHEDDEYEGSIPLVVTPTAPTGDLWSDTLLKWCDEGKTSIGDVYLKGAAQPSFYLGLYNNAAEPDEDDVMTDIVEVETPGSNGYARIELADNEWTETSQGTFTNLAKTFTCATGAWGNVYGWFICTAASGTECDLVTAEEFSDGPYDVGIGDTVTVTPKLTFT